MKQLQEKSQANICKASLANLPTACDKHVTCNLSVGFLVPVMIIPCHLSETIMRVHPYIYCLYACTKIHITHAKKNIYHSNANLRIYRPIYPLLSNHLSTHHRTRSHFDGQPLAQLVHSFSNCTSEGRTVTVLCGRGGKLCTPWRILRGIGPGVPPKQSKIWLMEG